MEYINEYPKISKKYDKLKLSNKKYLTEEIKQINQK